MVHLSVTEAKRLGLDVGGAKSESKYKNRHVVVDGVSFDSQMEADRYGMLKLMERAGEIRDLEVHHRFRLVVNEIRICDYEADFIYRETRTNLVIVEDTKGVRTREFVIKKKLMQALFKVVIREVDGDGNEREGKRAKSKR